MTRARYCFFSSAAILALVLTACAYPINGADDYMPIAERYPITVEPSMEALRLAYDPARGGLDEDGAAELARFAREYVENGSGSIAVSVPSRFPTAAGNVADRLAAIGIPRSRIMLGSDAASANDVRVTYVRYRARAEACGDWSMNLGHTSENKTSLNFGCATQHNLAAMVADPRDLVAPKPLDPDDAQRRLTVLDKYRRGETTVTERTEEQSGAVSGVGGGGGM